MLFWFAVCSLIYYWSRNLCTAKLTVSSNCSFCSTIRTYRFLYHDYIFFDTIFAIINSAVCAVRQTVLLITFDLNSYLPFVLFFNSCIAPLARTDTLKECILLNSFCALLLLLSDNIKASTGVSLGTCSILSET